jgi:hypothetical protein
MELFDRFFEFCSILCLNDDFRKKDMFDEQELPIIVANSPPNILRTKRISFGR